MFYQEPRKEERPTSHGEELNHFLDAPPGQRAPELDYGQRQGTQSKKQEDQSQNSDCQAKYLSRFHNVFAEMKDI